MIDLARGIDSGPRLWYDLGMDTTKTPSPQEAKMTFNELLASGWTPPADDEHDSLFAPELGTPQDIEGVYATDGREAGFDRGRGSYR
jgi:hypothetical protein